MIVFVHFKWTRKIIGGCFSKGGVGRGGGGNMYTVSGKNRHSLIKETKKKCMLWCIFLKVTCICTCDLIKGH